MEDNADKRNKTEEALDTSVTSSGRPKRKLKPRNYSDEFYVFDNHGRLLPATPDRVEKHQVFVTSTPVKQPGMGKQRWPRNHTPVESVQCDGVDNSYISDRTAPVVTQTETSEQVDDSHLGKQISPRNISVLSTLVSETINHDAITQNNVIMHIAMENGQHNAADESTNEGSGCLLVSETETYVNNKLDVTCSNKGTSRSRQSRKNTTVLQEEETELLSSKTDIGCDSPQGISKKRTLGNISVTKGHNGNGIKETPQTGVNKKSLDETVKRQSKKSLKKTLERQSKESLDKTVERQSKKILDKTVERQSKKSLKKTLERQSKESLDKTVERQSKKIVDKTVERQSKKILDKTVERQSKKRKINISCKDTCLKENVISETQRAEPCEVNNKNRNILNTDIAYSVSEGDKAINVVLEKSVSAESGTEETNCNFGSREASVTHKVIMSSSFDSGKLPADINKHRGRQRKHVSTDSQNEIQSESNAVFVISNSESNAAIVTSGRQPDDISQQISTLLDLHSAEVEVEMLCEGTAAVVSKKRRGRPPKNASQNLSTLVFPEVKVEMAGEENLGLIKRRRGRPPKNKSQQAEDHSGESNLLGTEVDGQSGVIVPGQKKRRGRQTIIVPVQLGTLANQVDHAQGGESPYTCLHCGQELKNANAMKHHMMVHHSLMWSLQYPTGFENATVIIKKLGHIICQKCKKNFRFAQYYKHHQEWCGREDEMATCELCEKTLKAMWLYQHMTAHKTQEKKKLTRQNETLEQIKDEVKEEEDAEGESASKRLKRQAAKNALKLMSSLRDDTEQDQAVASEVSSEEHSDDDEDDEESSEQDEDISDSGDRTGKAKRTKKSGVKKNGTKRKRTEYPILNPARNHLWIQACGHIRRSAANKRLELYQEMYNPLQERMFPSMSPVQAHWKPLPDSEAEQYTLMSKESVQFAFGSAQSQTMEDGEHSLKFGQTLSHNGTSYCFTGGPIWAVEWCPVPQEPGQCHFLAISADRSTQDLPDGVTSIDGPGIIQIWSAGPLANKEDCCAVPVLKYCIAHDSGYIHNISWCQKVCFDTSADDGYLKRLGLFAAACSDGRVLIYSPPQPEDLEPGSSSGEADGAVLVFRPPPALVLVPNSRKGCGPCLSVAWQPGGENKYVLAGYGDGAVYLWNIASTSPLTRVDSCTLRPIRCFSFHTAAIVSIAWNPVVPSVFVTVSLDFNLCLWNVNSSDQPFAIIKKLGHNLPRSVSWAGPVYNGLLTTCEKLTGYEDTPVSLFGMSKAVLYSAHKYMTIQYHAACTWDISYCPYHEAMVTCDALGIVRFTLLSMEDLITQKPGKMSWHRSKCRSVDLYQIKLSPRSQPSVTHAEEAAQDMLHFLNCEKKKEELKPVKSKSDEKLSCHMFRGSNANAVHKVRLNPNPSTCLWLASGGQSGILRVDNLKRLV